MEASASFNVSAAGGADVSSGADAGGAAESSQGSVSAPAGDVSQAPASESYAAPTAASTQDAAPELAQSETIAAETQSLNDEQDLRLEDQAQISERNHQARQKLEEDLSRRYGETILQLQTDTDHLQDVLDNSGPVRLAWLKFTRQIPKDPEADLKFLRSAREKQEYLQASERTTFELSIRSSPSEYKAQTTAAKQAQSHDAAQARSQRPAAMARDQASERLAFLEDHRPAPASEAHLRPGGRVEQYVHSDVSVQHEGEISALKAFIARQAVPSNDPGYAPESDAALDQDEGLEPHF